MTRPERRAREPLLHVTTSSPVPRPHTSPPLTSSPRSGWQPEPMSLSSSSSQSASSLSRRLPARRRKPVTTHLLSPLSSGPHRCLAPGCRKPPSHHFSGSQEANSQDTHTFYPRPSTHLKQANNGLRHIHERAMEKKTSVNIARTGLWNEIKMQDTCAKFMPVSRWEKKSTAASRHPPLCCSALNYTESSAKPASDFPFPFPPQATLPICASKMHPSPCQFVETDRFLLPKCK